MSELETLLDHAKIELKVASDNRRDHLDMGYKKDCNYYIHWTRMYEHYRGRVNVLIELKGQGYE